VEPALSSPGAAHRSRGHRPLRLPELLRRRARGHYSLNRGGALWRLLAAITKHKLLRQARSQTADRRSVEVEVSLHRIDEGKLVGRLYDPTPEDAAALADELERVLEQLSSTSRRIDPFGRRVLELRLQGQQIPEIAEDTGRSERSVRRSLARIRELLAERERRHDD
jgi:DNA-directed RNA polymerase specialized sigma24 family protein